MSQLGVGRIYFVGCMCSTGTVQYTHMYSQYRQISRRISRNSREGGRNEAGWISEAWQILGCSSSSYSSKYMHARCEASKRSAKLC